MSEHPEQPIADQPENAELEEEKDEDAGAMSLDEVIDIKKLRIIRDNFPEIFKRLGGIWIQDNQDFEYKEADEKTAFTLINDYYRQKVKTSKVSYKFLARLKVGRRFSKGISLQGISRKIRHTIAKDLYYDVDMKNAHPTFCLNLAKTLEFPHPVLEMYINRRDECLAKWIGVEVGSEGAKTRLKSKDEVKDYFLKILNGGGNSKSSSDELNNYYKTHQTFLDLVYKHKDFASFRKRADNKYTDKQKKDKPANDKKKEWDNRKGTTLNYYM